MAWIQVMSSVVHDTQDLGLAARVVLGYAYDLVHDGFGRRYCVGKCFSVWSIGMQESII